MYGCFSAVGAFSHIFPPSPDSRRLLGKRLAIIISICQFMWDIEQKPGFGQFQRKVQVTHGSEALLPSVTLSFDSTPTFCFTILFIMAISSRCLLEIVYFYNRSQ